MSGPNINDWFAGASQGTGAGRPGAGLWEAMEQLRGFFDPKTGGTRMGRGDVRAAVLTLLAEKPMHGYQIIQEIDERSGGSWKPSPGSVYPTLQLLTDEGLVVAEESNGRKTYALTDEGRQVADAASEESAPWESQTSRESARGALPRAGVELAQAVAQVGRSGSSAQVEQAIAVLDEARRKLYSLLAQG